MIDELTSATSHVTVQNGNEVSQGGDANMKNRVFTFTGVHLLLVVLVVVAALLTPNLISKACYDGTSCTISCNFNGECGHRIWGWIHLWNIGEESTEGLRIALVVQHGDGHGHWYNIFEGQVDLGDWDVLGPGESHSYSCHIPCDLPELKENGVLLRAVAHATISNHSGHQFNWGGFGPSSTAYFYFE
jgi:hypothetical protein